MPSWRARLEHAKELGTHWLRNPSVLIRLPNSRMK